MLPPNRVERRRAGCGSPKIDSRTCLPSFGSSRIGSETFLPNCRTPKMGFGTCLPSSGTWEIGSGTFLRSSPQAPPRLDFNHPQLGVDKPQLGRGWSAARQRVVCSLAEGGPHVGEGWSAARRQPTAARRPPISAPSRVVRGRTTLDAAAVTLFGAGDPLVSSRSAGCGTRGSSCWSHGARSFSQQWPPRAARCPFLVARWLVAGPAVPASRHEVAGHSGAVRVPRAAASELATDFPLSRDSP